MPPIIPNYTPAGGDWRQSTPDPSAAAAPGLALADTGRAVLGAADDVSAVGMKIKQVREADALNRARMEFAKARANHSEFRMRTPDQTQWGANLDREISAARERLGELSVGPAARQRIDTEWQTWTAEEANQTRVDSVKFEMTRARQNYSNLRESYIRAGKFDDADALTDNAVSTGILVSEEGDSDRLDHAKERDAWRERAAEKAELDAIAADPVGRLRELEANAPPPDADDATRAKHNRLVYQAKQAKVRVETDFADSIREGMYPANGQPPRITTPEQIEQLGADISPSVVATLKQDLIDLYDPARKAAINKPEYQSQLISTVSSMLENLDIQDSDQIVNFERHLNQMQPGPVKSHYSSVLANKLRGETGGDDWILDHGLSVVKELEKAGTFGEVPKQESFKTERAINNGALNSIGNLKAAGFTDEQANDIANAKDKDGNITNKSRLDKLRAMWTQRGEVPKDADPFVVATMNAIGDGTESYTVDDPKATDKAMKATWDMRAKSGKVREDFIRWRKSHPKATETEARAEILRLGGGSAETAWDSVIDDPADAGVLPPRDTPYTGQEYDPNQPIIDLPPP